MAVLIGSSLPVSFAVDVVQVSSPLSEPVTMMSGGDIVIYYVRKMTDGNIFLDKLSVENGGTYLFIPALGNNPRQLYLACSNQNFVSSVETFDVKTGNFIGSGSFGYNGTDSQSGYYLIRWRNGYYPSQVGAYSPPDFEYGFWILPDGLTIREVNFPVLETLNVNPFVQWSQYPPEHNIYHSHLSEPVADEFNRYFIINNKLYWLSFRLQGVYVLKQDIKTDSEVHSYTIDSDIIGTIQSPESQLVLLGSQTTYNDFEVYPITSDFEALFDSKLIYPALYYNGSSTELRLNLDQYGLMKAISSDHLFLDGQIYLSSFNLEDGTYISSKFFSLEQNILQHVIIDNSLENPEDIKCYGIDFLNVNATPVNLSDVLWEYDIEFAQWRSDIRSLLQSIFNTLSEAQSMPDAPTTSNWQEDLSSAEPRLQVSPAEVESAYNVVGNDINQELGDSASTLHEWVDIFSVNKLIRLVIFALTVGTAILLLGKKKSE